MSNFRSAHPEIIICPRCGETLFPGHPSLVEQQPNGVCYCNSCGQTFRPPPKETP